MAKARRRKRYPKVPKTKRAKRKVKTTMREFSKGTLKTRGGRRVRSRKQAIAIALAQARRRGKR
jgi:hypothetical protein